MSKYLLSDNNSDFLEPTVTQYGSSMVMTNVNKPRKTMYLNIDTKFTDDYDKRSQKRNDENFTITLPERINDVRSVTVSQVEIPIVFHNMSLDLGNSYFAAQNDTTKVKTVVKLPDGYYNESNTHTFLANMPSDLKLTMNPNKRLELSNISSSMYIINFAVNENGDDDKYSVNSKLGWLLGFRKNIYTIEPNKSIVAESLMDCSPIRYMYLVLDEFTNSCPNSFMSFYTHSQMNKKIIAKIPLGSSIQPRTLLIGNDKNGVLISDTRLYNGKVDLQRLNVRLVNEWGKVIDLNGSDFSFLLKIEHE